MCDYFSTAETTYRNYHFTNIQDYKKLLIIQFTTIKINTFIFNAKFIYFIEIILIYFFQLTQIIPLFLQQLLSCFLISAKMYPYRDTEDQSFLDKLQSQMKQLVIRLGNQKKQENRLKITSQIQRLKQQYKKIIPYEKYNDLKNEQSQMRKLLQISDQKLDKLKLQKQQLIKSNQELVLISQSYVKKVQEIKEKLAIIHKIQNLIKQTYLGQNLIKGLSDKNSNNQLQLEKKLQFIKNAQIDLRQKIKKVQKKVKQTNILTEKSVEQKQQETKRWQGLIQRKQDLHKKLNNEKVKQLNNSTIIKRSIISATPTVEPSQQSFQIRRVSRSINTIKAKQFNPKWYWCWTIFLIIWAIVLLWLTNKRKIISGDDYCY